MCQVGFMEISLLNFSSVCVSNLWPVNHFFLLFYALCFTVPFSDRVSCIQLSNTIPSTWVNSHSVLGSLSVDQFLGSVVFGHMVGLIPDCAQGPFEVGLRDLWGAGSATCMASILPVLSHCPKYVYYFPHMIQIVLFCCCFFKSNKL